MTAAEFVTVLIITLFLVVISFIAGLKLSGWYHRQAEDEKRYALEKQYLRLKANADADDPVGPYVPRRRVQLPTEFEEQLKTTGRATVSLNPNS